MTKKIILCTTIISGIVLLNTACKNSSTSNTSKADSATVSVKATPGTPIKYDSSKRYIFLTWDDGPQPPGTVNCKKNIS